MATAISPCTIEEESPNSAGVRPVASILMTARSVFSSMPSSVASYSVPSMTRTVMDCAPLTTWALVMMVPSSVIITPEPVPVDQPLTVLMATTEGLALAIIWGTVSSFP